MVSEFHMKVAGVTHEGRQGIIRKLRAGDQLYFIPEPTNPYDNHAVRIYTSDNQNIGFIPKEHNYRIFENLVHGIGQYTVKVSAITGGGFSNYGCNIHVVYNSDSFSQANNSNNDNFLETNNKSNTIEDIKDKKNLDEEYNQLLTNSFASADDYCNLGLKFMGYDGYKPDYDKAAELLLIAAKQDCYDAQNYLGTLYYNGLGVPQNNTKARFWLEESARNNNIKAKENLKFMFNERN